jgi:hypothetical protein
MSKKLLAYLILSFPISQFLLILLFRTIPDFFHIVVFVSVAATLVGCHLLSDNDPTDKPKK